MARPSELTQDVADTLLTSLERMPIKSACALAGVAPSTYRRWVRRGEAGEPLYEEFAIKARRVRASFAQELVRGIETAGKDDWRASAWLLERLFPREFGLRQRIEARHRARIESGSTREPQPDLSVLTNDELRTYHDILTKATTPSAVRPVMAEAAALLCDLGIARPDDSSTHLTAPFEGVAACGDLIHG